MKLIDFYKYCRTCKYKSVSQTEDPCNSCLTVPATEDSHKPVKYEEASSSET